ncbi:hypothetical protein [Mesobacillus sp.]
MKTKKIHQKTKKKIPKEQTNCVNHNKNPIRLKHMKKNLIVAF